MALPPGTLYTRFWRQGRQTNAGTYNSQHSLEGFLEVEVPAWRCRWMGWGRGEERKGRDLGCLEALVSEPTTQLVSVVSRRPTAARPQGPRGCRAVTVTIITRVPPPLPMLPGPWA